MKKQFQLCIIIPAFNEEAKLDMIAYQDFLTERKDCALVIVNDCSTDSTLHILDKLQKQSPDNCFVITNKKNMGKAESVRNGMLFGFENIEAKKYAFLDADLATSFDECVKISETVTKEITFAFGSRILTIDSNIERKAYRHYIGRIVATAISKVLKLEVYDTQCGCKVFDKKLATQIFKTPFISRWLFDVELFFRTLQYYGREVAIKKLHEHPLKNWEDKGESKVKFSYFFKLWLDLWKIKSLYRTV